MRMSGCYRLFLSLQEFELPLVVKENLTYDYQQGFLQVPIPGKRELYAIKFKNPGDGETFYAKINNELSE